MVQTDPLIGKQSWLDGRLNQVRTQVLGRSTSQRRSLTLNHALRQVHRHLYAAQSATSRFAGADSAAPWGKALRREAFGHLLQAERTLDGLEEKVSHLTSGRWGGSSRLLLRSKALTLLVDVRRGGQLLELSDKVAGRNLQDTFIPESRLLHRSSLVDHLFASETSLKTFMQGKAKELGDFSKGVYTSRMQRTGNRLEAVLNRESQIRLGGARYPVVLTKRIGIPSQARSMTTRYRLQNRSTQPLTFLFGSELNLTLKDAHVNRVGEAQGIRRFAVVDPAAGLQVTWNFSRSAQFWHFPMETQFKIKSNLQRSYDGASLTFLWKVNLKPRGSWTVGTQVAIGEPQSGS